MGTCGISKIRARVSIYSSMSLEGDILEKIGNDDGIILSLLSCKYIFFKGGFHRSCGKVLCSLRIARCYPYICVIFFWIWEVSFILRCL